MNRPDAFAELKSKTSQAKPYGAYTRVREDDVQIGPVSAVLLQIAAARRLVGRALQTTEIQVRYEDDRAMRQKLVGELMKLAAEQTALEALFHLQLSLEFSNYDTFSGPKVTLRKDAKGGVIAVIRKSDALEHAESMRGLDHALEAASEEEAGGHHDCTDPLDFLRRRRGADGLPPEVAEAIEKAFGGRLQVVNL